jgi:hypothetical protein
MHLKLKLKIEALKAEIDQSLVYQAFIGDYKYGYVTDNTNLYE